MTRNILITLLRADLRLHDHPIFSTCAESSSALPNLTHVLPIYVFDQKFMEVGHLPGIQKASGPGCGEARTRVGKFWRCGVHRTRFLTRSVFDLKSRLNSVGSDLSLWAGQPHAVLPALIKALNERGDHVEAVWMSGEPHTEEKTTEKKIEKALAATQTPFKLFYHSTLIHPDDLPFLIKDLPDVFTHFRKRVEAPDMFRDPLAAPDKLKPFPEIPKIEKSAGIYEIDMTEDVLGEKLLEPILNDPGPIKITADQKEVPNAFPFHGGETEALERLDHYFNGGPQAPAAKYKETRNEMLGTDYSTKFSAPLAFGLISPRLIAQAAKAIDEKNGVKGKGGGYWIIFELLWRDYFSFVSQKYGSNLYTLEGIEGQLDSKTASERAKQWKYPTTFEDSTDGFVRWAQYETGIPLIDANMKELAITGFMSNRGRQNVASILTKDLYYDWRLGAEWFESFLVDYDPSSNYGNWQYVAGVGNDPRASRQFNPIKQAKDYDGEAKYVKAWLPALREMPQNDAHHPWTRSEGSPSGYPRSPVVENPMWKAHYRGGPKRGGMRGGRGRRGGGGGGQTKGRGGSKGHQQ